ncbi:MAG: 3-hydroxyacyl-CoA dehydrogenase family protein [Bacteroidales bacterium]|nr:3-hydroxyacyl-CoA dehydrogenase family protein [Bacteroidales bacterium]
MNYVEKLSHSAVLGAAGKMGSGITLLLATEMVDLSLKPENKDRLFRLHAIDISAKALQGLQDYLRAQLLRIAEKKAVALRAVYLNRHDLIENRDIIRQYVDDAMRLISFSTRAESAYDAHLVFEAAVEDVDLKVAMIRQIEENSAGEPWYLTNTSSIPISELNEQCSLDGRIVGFHFYNPPAVQRILEYVAPAGTRDDLADFSLKLAASMRKVVVKANDFAGFIGNGFLMRDILFGIDMAMKLTEDTGFTGAVYAVNRVSNDFLLRPMGVFQLMDYVGIDVCQKIMKVMSERLDNPGLHSPLIDRLIALDVTGGQYSDGTQKPGMFSYAKGKISGVYDPDLQNYVPLDDVKVTADKYTGPLPETFKPWKEVIRIKDRGEILARHFDALKKMDSPGSVMAMEYLRNARAIGLGLIADGIANSAEDVNTVMMTGFYHAYGLINDFAGD